MPTGTWLPWQSRRGKWREWGGQGYCCPFFLGYQLERRFTKNHKVIPSARQWFMQLVVGVFHRNQIFTSVLFWKQVLCKNYLNMLQSGKAAWALLVPFFFLGQPLPRVSWVYSHYQLVGTPGAAFSRKPSGLTLPFLLSKWPLALTQPWREGLVFSFCVCVRER